jgi:hypothetical protein
VAKHNRALVTLGDSWVVPIMPGTSSYTGTTGGSHPMATPDLQQVCDGELYLGVYFLDVHTVSHTTVYTRYGDRLLVGATAPLGVAPVCVGGSYWIFGLPSDGIASKRCGPDLGYMSNRTITRSMQG